MCIRDSIAAAWNRLVFPAVHLVIDGQITIRIKALFVYGHKIPNSLAAFLIINTVEVLLAGICYLFNIFTNLDFRYHGIPVKNRAHFIHTAEYRRGFTANQIFANPHAVDLRPL